MKILKIEKGACRSNFTSQAGFIIVSFLLLSVILLIWGLLVIKTEQNYTKRAELNILLQSTFNAASNAGPEPSRMFEVGCYHLGQKFNMVSAVGSNVDNCNSATFVLGTPPVPITKTYNTVPFLDGSGSCETVTYRYDPGTIDQNNIKARELCIDVAGCALTNNFVVPLVSNEPYLFGASGCFSLKPAVTMVAMDNSRKMYRTFAGGTDLPPPIFLHPESGYSALAAQQAQLELNSLPLLFSSHLSAYPPRTSTSPWGQYIYPFSTKEYSVSGAIRSIYSNPGQPTTFPTGPNASAFINSIPNVVPQTSSGVAPEPLNSPDPSITGEDPIQYISLMRGGIATRTWATQDIVFGQYSNYRWRHGVMTMNELANRCFNPKKLWSNRIAQQVMYMLENYKIPFGALTYSNWILGLMPLIPYEHRFNPAWGLTDPGSTLDFPVLGPNPATIPPFGGVGVPQYFEEQFGNQDNQAVVTGGILTRATNFNLTFQPMTLCAREMNHRIIPDIGGVSQPPHVFTALPDPYDFTRRVTPATTACSNINAHRRPTLEGIPNFGFIFRADTTSGAVSGDCFGDGTPATDNIEYAPATNPCVGTAPYEMPNWMRRDESLAPAAQNIDAVPLVSITNPYRLCPDTTEIESTLGTNNINVAMAVSLIRSGGMTKSGNPVNVYEAGGTTPSGSLTDNNSRQRYFTSVTDWGAGWSQRVYPEAEHVTDDFTPGALVNAYNVLTDPEWVPNPDLVRKIVILFSDGKAILSMKEVLAGRWNGSWFQPDPPPNVLPIISDADVNSSPFNTAIKESLQVIHTMADSGLIVIVVTLDEMDASAADIDRRRFFSYGLREPIGVASPTSNKYAYALCRPCGYASPADGVPLGGEPAVQSLTPCSCHLAPPGKNIHEIRVTRQLLEDWPTYQARMFRRVAIDVNRILNSYTQTK